MLLKVWLWSVLSSIVIMMIMLLAKNSFTKKWSTKIICLAAVFPSTVVLIIAMIMMGFNSTQTFLNIKIPYIKNLILTLDFGSSLILFILNISILLSIIHLHENTFLKSSILTNLLTMFFSIIVLIKASAVYAIIPFITISNPMIINIISDSIKKNTVIEYRLLHKKCILFFMQWLSDTAIILSIALTFSLGNASNTYLSLSLSLLLIAISIKLLSTSTINTHISHQNYYFIFHSHISLLSAIAVLYKYTKITTQYINLLKTFYPLWIGLIILIMLKSYFRKELSITHIIHLLIATLLALVSLNLNINLVIILIMTTTYPLIIFYKAILLKEDINTSAMPEKIILKYSNYISKYIEKIFFKFFTPFYATFIFFRLPQIFFGLFQIPLRTFYSGNLTRSSLVVMLFSFAYFYFLVR